MADSPAIVVREVSKKYRLYASAKHRLLEALHPFKRTYHREFWALKGVSFEVPRGQTVGIIGRNGSGKSTLLQIVCSILQPTAGEVEVTGRVSALLELGTGFNPEFTGRDNVDFYCRLMGVPAQQIPARLTEIEAFADIGQFFDQPVKIYSSGMFVRLGFAAAIHVDPDILVVDEALAVGDAKFQRKCYQKFVDFREAGKTILLVTHSQETIVRQCDRAVLLEGGEVLQNGDPNEVCNRYHELLFGPGPDADDPTPDRQPPDPDDEEAPEEADDELARFLRETPAADRAPTRRNYNKNEHRFGTAGARILDYLVVCDGRHDVATVRSGQSVDVYLKVLYHQDIEIPAFGFTVKTVDGVTVYGTSSFFRGIRFSPARAGQVIVFKASFGLNVQPGDVFVSLGVGDRGQSDAQMLDIRHDLIHLLVETTHYFDGLVDFDSALGEVGRLRKP